MKNEQNLKYPELTERACLIAAENPEMVKHELECFYLDHPVQPANDLLYKMYHGWLQYQAVTNVETDCDELEEMYFYHYRLSRLLVAAYVAMREVKDGKKVLLDEGKGVLESHPSISEELKPVVELMIMVVQPEKLFLWRNQKGGEASASDEVELMFILQDVLQQRFADLQPQLDFMTAGQTNLHCSLCVNGTFVEAFKNCELLFLTHCIPANLVYDATQKPMPQVAVVDLVERKSKCEVAFKWAIEMAHSFFVQAGQSKDVRLTALLLHQCAEHSYRAIITAFRGKERKTHDLVLLNKEMSRMAPGMCSVFAADDVEGMRMLGFLSDAYCHSRYSEGFVISDVDLVLLRERVGRLPNLAEVAFKGVMGVLDFGE